MRTGFAGDSSQPPQTSAAPALPVQGRKYSHWRPNHCRPVGRSASAKCRIGPASRRPCATPHPRPLLPVVNSCIRLAVKMASGASNKVRIILPISLTGGSLTHLIDATRCLVPNSHFRHFATEILKASAVLSPLALSEQYGEGKLQTPLFFLMHVQSMGSGTHAVDKRRTGDELIGSHHVAVTRILRRTDALRDSARRCLHGSPQTN
jgi:hypothetical protein